MKLQFKIYTFKIKSTYSHSTVSSAFLLLIKFARRVMKNKEGVAEEDVEEMISGIFVLYLFFICLYLFYV